jgi:low-affinity ferrous iron transport protein
MRFYQPILRCEFEGVAETQIVAVEKDIKYDVDVPIAEESVLGYKVKASPRLVDIWLDTVVHIAGSAPMFLLIIGGLLTWALMGVHFGQSDVWVAMISDVQAILCYVFDSFLMRQLLREYSEQRSAMAVIKSRYNSQRRMLYKIKDKMGSKATRHIVEKWDGKPLRPLDHGMRTQSLFARCVFFSAKLLGHIITVGLYWIGIFIWLGFGYHCGWSNRWQLYINDATSALMILVFALLACLRESYTDYTNTCVDAIFQLDSILEKELRRLSLDDLPNTSEIIMPPKENHLQIAIFYYADVIGTLVGIIILLLAIITWVGVGPVFQFSNTWWLLIGTYAGLVGLFDSFVLRNIQGKVHQFIKSQIEDLDENDEILFNRLSLPMPSAEEPRSPLSIVVCLCTWMQSAQTCSWLWPAFW